MLFDVRSGKRRRVIQIVFSFLAILFAVSFIGFGIGGNVNIDPSQIFGGGGDGSTSETYKEDIDEAEATLAQDPENEQALIDLATARVLTGREELTSDEQSTQPEVTDEARAEFEQAFDAWDRYVALDPQRPDVIAARQILQAYTLVGDYEGAAETQQVIADDDPSTQNLLILANYRYADADLQGVTDAGDRAVEASSKAERGQVQKQVDALLEQTEKLKKRLAQQGGSPEDAQQAIEDPFGGFDAGGTAPTP